MSIEGVDYSSNHPDPEGLWTVGKRFAIRYFGAGGSWKHATRKEVDALAAAGLTIVTNVEGMENGLLGGRPVGAEWARLAHDHAVACGMPPDRPIYLSVDFDVQASQWPAVAEGLRGAADEIGPARVGVYGGYDAIAWAARDHVAHWFWQTYAWSKGSWHPIAYIRQYRNGVSLVGGTVDLDLAMVSDFGQWRPNGGDMPLDATDLVKIRDTVWQARYGSTGLGAPPRPTADWIKDALALTQKLDERWDRIKAILDTLDIPALLANVADVEAAVNALTVRVDALAKVPLVDPVAVAAAIASHPEISATLADQVAARLSHITGALTLSGSADLGIVASPG